MVNQSFYGFSDGGRADNTRLLLKVFNRSQLEDIIYLIGRRGSSVINDIHSNTTTYDPPSFMGIFSADYIQRSDMPRVFLGATTMMLASVRKPAYGNDEYADALEQAFSIPTGMAISLANKIETLDFASDPAATGMWDGWVVGLYSRAKEALRHVVNNISAAAGLEYLVNWDQDQSLDKDMFYELALFGDAVADLGTRGRLIVARAQVSAEMGLFTGDSTDDQAQAVLSRIVQNAATLGRKPLPASLMGNYAGLQGDARRKAADELKGDVEHLHLQGGPVGKMILAAIKKIAGGVASNNDVAKLFSKSPNTKAYNQGLNDASSANDDAMTKTADNISEMYGDHIGQAWLEGDIDTICGDAFLTNALEEGDPTYEDPNDLNMIGDSLSEDMHHLGDTLDMHPDDVASLIGGPFSKLKKRKQRAQAAGNAKGFRKGKAKERRSQKRSLKMFGKQYKKLGDEGMAAYDRFMDQEVTRPQYSNPQYDGPDQISGYGSAGGGGGYDSYDQQAYEGGYYAPEGGGWDSVYEVDPFAWA